MPSILGSILRAVWRAFCGPSGNDQQEPQTQQQQQQHVSYTQHLPGEYIPQPEQPRPPRPQQQQYHYPKPQQQQQQQQQPQPPKKPFHPYDPNRPRPTDAPHYINLRARANEAGDKMGKCFDGSQDAYRRGDGALAKKLSEEGKAHQAEMNRLHKEAARWVYNENNKDREPGEVDLHGLFVKEAVDFTEEAIKSARSRGDQEIRLIVGKGLHSQNNVAKIKPAIEKLMRQNNLVAVLDPDNSGVLIVHLDGRGSRGRGRTVTPDEITRGLQDKECIIM